MNKVVHVKDKVPNAVYIGRGSEWGNPYHIGIDGTREEVIAKYKKYLWDRMAPALQEDISAYKDLGRLASLHGKQLACYCAPQACHGDVLVKASAWAHSIYNPKYRFYNSTTKTHTF